MTKDELFWALMIACALVPISGLLTYYSYLRYYALSQQVKSLNIKFFEAKLLINRYDNLVKTCIEKDIKRSELLDQFLQGGICANTDIMATLSRKDRQISEQYKEILKLKQEQLNSI